MGKGKQTGYVPDNSVDNGPATATAELPPPADPQQNGNPDHPAHPATIGTPRKRRGKSAPEGETKDERFRRLATRRVNRSIKCIGHVANLANRSNYHYTEDERKAVCAAIICATNDLVATFERIKPASNVFSLPA